MRFADTAGVARAQRLARAVVHDVAAGVRAGDREIDVVRAVEGGLARAGVKHWLHTAYAWWGERSRFAGVVDWEPDALPTGRRLAEGEAFIIDVAPLVDSYPADYAYSGFCGDGAPGAAVHAAMCAALDEMKRAIVDWAREAADGASLTTEVSADMERRGYDVIFPLYPAGVLGHLMGRAPRLLAKAPRVGDGFQLPLLGGTLVQLWRHRIKGASYPLINSDARRGRPVGLYAIEPHLAKGAVGAKFESILLIDGDETRWLDPGLFGEVVG